MKSLKAVPFLHNLKTCVWLSSLNRGGGKTYLLWIMELHPSYPGANNTENS